MLVIVPDDAEPQRKRSRLFYENLGGLHRGADVIVLTRANFEGRAQHVVASLPATVVREGRLLYAA